jgi:2-polyprenyl-3-methyl-5-hydroxy-6-metoxy-1,4-benzoquinol methylase
MYDESFWNKRYANGDYLYGTEPNSFLAEHFSLLSGPILSLSEGEGRNAVFLASRGLEILGVDISMVALEKAKKLAKEGLINSKLWIETNQISCVLRVG